MPKVIFLLIAEPGSDDRERIGIDFDLLGEGGVELLVVPWGSALAWLHSPLSEENLTYVLSRFRDESMNSLEKFVDSHDFVLAARDTIIEEILEYNGSGEIPVGWQSLVSLVLVDSRLGLQHSRHARRVLEGWFGEARVLAYALNVGGCGFQDMGSIAVPEPATPVVVDEQIDAIKAALDTPIIQLVSFSVQEAEALGYMRITTLRQLVHSSDEDLARIGLEGDRRIARFIGELQNKGLSREGETWYEFARRVIGAIGSPKVPVPVAELKLHGVL